MIFNLKFILFTFYVVHFIDIDTSALKCWFVIDLIAIQEIFAY